MKSHGAGRKWLSIGAVGAVSVSDVFVRYIYKMTT